MGLTYGRAPFAKHPGGEFNFRRDGPTAVLYWEDVPKRVRVEFNGAMLADSRRVKALHETGRMPVFYFPRDDIDRARLTATAHHTDCPHKGRASYWSVRVGDRVAENAVWAYDDPIESAAFLVGHAAFEYGRMDAWYEEDDRVYARPRDPYHRFDVHRSSRHVVVRHGGRVVADCRRPWLLFETGIATRYYLPPEDVRRELLSRSETLSHCPYKGAGQHWNLSVGDETVRDAAWTLPDPLGEAQPIANCFCFYPDKVQIDVDGERLAADAP